MGFSITSFDVFCRSFVRVYQARRSRAIG